MIGIIVSTTLLILSAVQICGPIASPGFIAATSMGITIAIASMVVLIWQIRNSLPNIQYQRALSRAITGNNSTEVNRLIDKNVISGQSSEESLDLNILLLKALEKYAWDVALELIQRGADITASPKVFFPLLLHKVRVTDCLLSYMISQLSLFEAESAAKILEMALQVAEKKMNIMDFVINHRDYYGNTLLHKTVYLTRSMDNPIVKVLLQKGVDLKVKNKKGHTCQDIVNAYSSGQDSYACSNRVHG